jgi:hypothetical protein
MVKKNGGKVSHRLRVVSAAAALAGARSARAVAASSRAVAGEMARKHQYDIV